MIEINRYKWEKELFVKNLNKMVKICISDKKLLAKQNNIKIDCISVCFGKTNQWFKSNNWILGVFGWCF